MLTDGLFRLHKVVIPYNIGDTFTLRPVGDIHRDSDAFADDVWETFKTDSMKRKKMLYLGMGDYFDNFSTSERIVLGDDRLHETTIKTFEKMARQKVKDLANELSFMRGHLLGLLGGNHFISFVNGTSSDMLLAGELDTTYLGSCAVIRVAFQEKSKHNGGTAAIDIFAHHGRGGGRTATGHLMAVEKMAQMFECDIYLQGHDHSRAVIPLGDKLRVVDSGRNLVLRSRHCFIGRTGSFLRGYVDKKTSYTTDSLLPPSSLGTIDFTMTPARSRKDGLDRVTVEIQAVQ